MRLLLTLGLVACVATAGRADEAVTIKIKVEADAGRTTTYKDSTKSSGVIKGLDGDGKVLFERKREAEEFAYKTTILAVDKDGKATKYLRTYDKATETEDGKAKTFSYQGRTILLEKKGGKFRLGVVGDKPLDPEDVEKLVKDANKKSESAALLSNLSPGKPVKVGDSWDLPVKPIAEAMEDAVVDLKKSKITAKLLKVYPKGKSQFGSIEVEGHLLMTAMSQDGLKIAFDPPATIDLKATMDLAIDGSSIEKVEKGTLKLKGEGNLALGDLKRKLIFDVATNGTEELSAEVDDPKATVVPKVTFAAAPGEWSEFKPKSGAFSVQFPGKPKEMTKKADGATETQWQVEVGGGTLLYSVVQTDFKSADALDDNAILKAAVAALKNVKSEKEIKVGGFPGVEVEYEQAAGGLEFSVTRRIIMVNGRAYELVALAIKGKKAEADKFFKSFKLVGAKPKDD